MIRSWNQFNWPNIHIRILKIQDKIFKATRSYNKKFLYRLQNYLLNSSEARLIAIEHIISKINNSYKHKYLYNHRITISTRQKTILFKILFIKLIDVSSNLYLVIEKIRQYIIYLCIYPEWQAKLEPSLQYDNKIDTCKSFRDKLNIKYFKLLYLNNQINSKQYIQYWYQNNYLRNILIIKYNSCYSPLELINSQDIFSICKLIHLVNKIYCNGYCWNNLYTHIIYNKSILNCDKKLIEYNKYCNIYNYILLKRLNKINYLKNYNIYKLIAIILKQYYYCNIKIAPMTIINMYVIINIKIFNLLKKHNKLFQAFLYNRNKNIKVIEYIYRLNYQALYKYIK